MQEEKREFNERLQELQAHHAHVIRAIEQENLAELEEHKREADKMF
jgi:hypothetical protein